MRAGGTRGRIISLLACLPVAIVIQAGLASTAHASTAGVAVAGPAPLGGVGQVRPGELISAGFDLAMPGGHGDATVVVTGAEVQISLSCKQNQAAAGRMTVSLAGRTFAVPRGDATWHATSSTQDPAGYDGAAAVPDLCSGKQEWVDARTVPGAMYSADLTSADTTDPIQVRFHAVSGDVDCTDPGQNPSPGSNDCDAGWTAATVTTAARPAGNPAPGSPGGTGAAGSTAGSGAGAAHGAASPPVAPTRVTAAAATKSPARALAIASPVSARAAPVTASTPPDADLPLSVILAPAAPSRGSPSRSPLSPEAGLAASLLGQLPLPWVALLAAADALLAVALIVRCRRTKEKGGLPDVGVQ
jgi:hypothetical protein